MMETMPISNDISFDIRIIETPIGKAPPYKNLHSGPSCSRERHLQDFLFKYPEYITEGLISITQEFRIPTAGQVDLLCIKDNTLYLVEVKIGRYKRDAIHQISRYLRGMKSYSQYLLRKDLRIKGILIFFIPGGTETRESTVKGYPLTPLLNDGKRKPIYDQWLTKLNALDENIHALKAREKELLLAIEKLEKKFEIKHYELQTLKNDPLYQNELIKPIDETLINDKPTLIQIHLSLTET